MSLFIDTSERSSETEIMDDFSLEGELLRDTLDKLGHINKWLGGNRVTISGIKKLLSDRPKEKVYTIMDLGCGHGDILRLISKWGIRNNYKLKLVGIDANQDAIRYAIQLSENFENISFIKVDIFSEEFEEMEYDIVLSTLFLHHFKNEEIERILEILVSKARLGVVINDLHRDRVAYFLFKLLGYLIPNKMIVQDGLTSILRAFKRRELEQMSQALQLRSQIQWKWAFRYQWLIKI